MISAKAITSWSLVGATIFCLLDPVSADETRSVFLIGNSLTWDTVPPKLGANVTWHVDCGKSLPYMLANPQEPCVKSSTLWPDGLRKASHDFLVLQLHYGSTAEQDLEAIATLIELQPDAQIVIHTGWPRSASRETEWNSKLDQPKKSSTMRHSVDYFEFILRELRKEFPSRKFSRTRAIEALQVVASECGSPKSPFSKVEELYRDNIHMNIVTGRYLMHNLMRRAVGRKPSQVGFEKLSLAEKKYFDEVLERVFKRD